MKILNIFTKKIFLKLSQLTPLISLKLRKLLLNMAPGKTLVGEPGNTTAFM
jgi:hypothetical protein